jgi:hypothetical protein
MYHSSRAKTHLEQRRPTGQRTAFSYIKPRREVTSTRPVCGLAFFMPRKGGLQMADDKKNVPDVASPTEAPAPTVEKAVVPEQPAPEPALTDAEAVMLEHEGQAALFEMGEAVPDPADAVTHTEVEEPTAPEVPKAEKEQEQPPTPGKDDPGTFRQGGGFFRCP